MLLNEIRSRRRVHHRLLLQSLTLGVGRRKRPTCHRPHRGLMLILWVGLVSCKCMRCLKMLGNGHNSLARLRRVHARLWLGV